MLTPRGTQPSLTFTRDDFRRAVVLGVILVAALTAIFALDLFPQRLVIQVGDVASADIVAPRADSYVSVIKTNAARDDASRRVEPVYDYGDEKADRIATNQGAALQRLVAPIDDAFAPGVAPEERTKLLRSFPGLTDASRVTLLGLDADRWKAVKDEASRVLDLTERKELRDTNVAPAKASLTQQMAGLDAGERTLASELISPLIVANSSFSNELTNQARQRAIDQVPDAVVDYAQNEKIVGRSERVTPLALEAIEEFGLLDARPDIARLGGWFLLAVLVATTLIGWVWRFRRQLWHRTNALVLIGLIVFGATLLLKVTAGR
jgi:membrane-associated HD superfamily phosphohydrolase